MFVRLAAPSLDDHRVLDIADAIEQRRVGTCLPFSGSGIPRAAQPIMTNY